MSLREYLSEISVPVYVTVSLFALSSWIDINGLFVETPILVNVLPEGWRLFSYLAIVIQVADVGPVVYTILRRKYPYSVAEWQAVYVIIGIGATACFLLAFFWQETTRINGEPHSTALFVLVSFLALVDCTSSVVYLPYMGQYKPQYMTAYYIGEGLSGMIPGLVGLIQGVQSEPRCVNVSSVLTNETTGENTTVYKVFPQYPPPIFSVQVFFFFLFAMLVLSCVSFTLLHFHPSCKRERRKDKTSTARYVASEDGDKVSKPIAMKVRHNTPKTGKNLQELIPTETEPLQAAMTNHSSSVCGQRSEIRFKLSNGQFVYILLLACWLNALSNGVLPSTNSYTCLPYGSLALTLAVRLSAVANPLICFLSLFIGTRSLTVIGLVSLLATGLSGWHLYLAAMSPYPPLKNTVAGTTLVVITQVTNIMSIIYANVSSASILTEYGSDHSLLWFGGATQIGSCVGAVITFIFVNVLRVFHSEPPCPGMNY